MSFTMSKMPAWLGAVVLFVGVGIALVFMLTGRKQVVVIPEKDRTMRGTLGNKVKGRTKFKVDSTWLDRPVRNAVVAFVPPGSSKPVAVRAVALPGDRLSVRNNKLYVNGKGVPTIERIMPQRTVPELVCPRDCFYVVLDSGQRGASDSLKHGPVPVWRLLGALEFD